MADESAKASDAAVVVGELPAAANRPRLRPNRKRPKNCTKVKFEPSEENWKFASWSGFVTPRTGVATLISPDVKILHAESSNKAIDLSTCEGLTIRYKCDAKKYSLVSSIRMGTFRLRAQSWDGKRNPFRGLDSFQKRLTTRRRTRPRTSPTRRFQDYENGVQFRAKVNAKLTALEDDGKTPTSFP